MVFSMFAVMPLTAYAADGPFLVTENPVGAIYTLNQTAVPIMATFTYDALAELGTIDSGTYMKVQWYWSSTNSNTGRTNGFGEHEVQYNRRIDHRTTLTPATNTAGIRYYYAVISYAVYVLNGVGVWSVEPRETATAPARIEVVNTASATINPTSVTFAKGGSGDITLAVDIAGHMAQSIKNGDYTLQAGTDFVINSFESMTLKAAYLNTLDAGIHTLYFNFDGGTSPTLTITVTEATIAPTITGPETMTLVQGYAATSTSVFTVAGDPVPAVAKTSGNDAIAWNGSTRKLDIAAGLPAGTYPVVLTATSGAITATHVFILTVTPGGGKPFPFIDVTPADWFYDYVKYAWEIGLINGKDDTHFAPNDYMTYAEAVKLAACMHQYYTTGSVTLANGSPNWYDSYVMYAKSNGIISVDYDWNEHATRAGYMEIFANALPDAALGAINIIPNGSIPDVPATHPQAAAIYKLYRAGILQGVDGAHNCNPNANIIRGEVAAILARMMDPDARLHFNM